jgi:outer membrane protein OmpA-like peptidoglycan-associated protein
LLAGRPEAAASGQSDLFKAVAPLGRETVFLLFTRAPLGKLFAAGTSSQSIGDEVASVAALVAGIKSAAPADGLAVARADYLVVAQSGDTQYTTRGIIRDLDALTTTPPGATESKTFPTQIQFEFDSDRITPEGKLNLDVFGEAMVQEQVKTLAIRLEGHTDDVGDDDYNLKLSVRRAQAARAYLSRSFGIAAERMKVAGFGESRPIAPNATAAGRARNRRVEFIFSAGAGADTPARQ